MEIGWTFLGRSYWGGRYNGELKRLMLGHAFRFVGTVIFLVVPDNLRSRRAVEKIGGVQAGTRADASGRVSLVYRILADEFAFSISRSATASDHRDDANPGQPHERRPQDC